MRNASIALTMVILLAGLPSYAADESAVSEIVAAHAPTVVTLRCVVKVQGGPFGARGQESPLETTGVVIDAERRIVLAAHTDLGGLPEPMQRMLSSAGGGVSSVPTDIRIFRPGTDDGTQGLPATLVARDQQLNLAWVRIDEEPAGKLQAVELEQQAETPRLGTHLIALMRAGRYFEHAALGREFRVAAITERPRLLFVPSAPIPNQLLPIFRTDGTLIGFSNMQFPDIEIDVNNRIRMQLDMAEMAETGPLVMPVELIRSVTERALAQAATQPATQPSAQTQPAGGGD